MVDHDNRKVPKLGTTHWSLWTIFMLHKLLQKENAIYKTAPKIKKNNLLKGIKSLLLVALPLSSVRWMRLNSSLKSATNLF